MKWKKMGTILKNPKLFEMIIQEFDKTIADEKDVREVIFLKCCSIYVENLDGINNLIVDGESSIGKSYITGQITNIFPKEILQHKTRISPKVLTYWKANDKEWSWNGKILFLEDVSLEILNSDVLKVLCSEGSKSVIVVRNKAIELHVEGKPFVIITTTKNAKNEILNRFDIVTLNEGEEQTEKIKQSQAKKATTSKIETYNPEIIEALKNLKRIKVNIPYAENLTKHFPNTLRTRRDFPRFLDLIKCSTALYQQQRKQDKEGYYIAEEQDYEIARNIINKIQGKSPVLGLSYKSKQILEICKIKDWFSIKKISREYPIVSEPTWYSHIDKLSELGLLEAKADPDDETHRATVYKIKINNVDKINLPEFKELGGS